MPKQGIIDACYGHHHQEKDGLPFYNIVAREKNFSVLQHKASPSQNKNQIEKLHIDLPQEC